MTRDLRLYLPPGLFLKIAMLEMFIRKNIVVAKFHKNQHVFQFGPLIKVTLEQISVTF
jgi:hypothetical protein